MSLIAVIDYGSGNVRSIVNALRRCASSRQTVELTADPSRILEASHLVLPGVGAFAACMSKLRETPALAPMRAALRQGRPFLGICVGMQILADLGEEFGPHEGLGIIPGVVRQLRPSDGHKNGWRIPHVGWTPLHEASGPLFAGIPSGAQFYFVHSFALECAERGDVAAYADYCGVRFAAAVARGNVWGCQFHPEKSSERGLQLLENFCRWKT